jgi:hypothetical protein
MTCSRNTKAKFNSSYWIRRRKSKGIRLRNLRRQKRTSHYEAHRYLSEATHHASLVLKRVKQALHPPEDYQDRDHR